MEQSCRRVDACRLKPTINQQNKAVAACAATTLLLCCCIVTCTATALQLGPSPSTSPRCTPCWFAHGYCNCALFALLRLPTALLPCRFKQPRQTAINGTVQNNAGEDRVDGRGDLSLHGKQFMW